MKFALEKPAFRILVNTQSALGAVGFTNGLDPSLTLGPGTIGGSIISDNVTARHMINIKRLAFETHPINTIEQVSLQKEKKQIDASASQTNVISSITTMEKSTSTNVSWLDIIDERIRLKAGNPPVHKKNESSNIPALKTESKFGAGISKEEIDKIIMKFK